MTDKQTPPDWVLIEAAKRCGWKYGRAILRNIYRDQDAFRALCDMIERYEQPPVDRKLLCAREAHKSCENRWDNSDFDACVRAIELWEEGFGK